MRPSTASILAAACLGLLLSFSAVTHAQSSSAAEEDQQARTLFEAATVRFDRQDYAGALQDFQQAYDLSGRAGLLYNIGLCSERVGQDERALTAYRGYVDQAEAGEKTDEVRGRIKTLEARIANKDISVATPEQAARAAAEADQPALNAAGTASVGDSEPLRKKWWLWTGVGGVVVATVVTSVLVATAEGGSSDPNTDLGTFTVGAQ